MHLIVVTPFTLIPTLSGGRLRNRHLVQALLDRGHTVELWMVDPSDGSPVPWPSPAPRLTMRHIPGRVRAGRRAKLAALLSRYPEAVWACPPPESMSGLGDIDAAILSHAHVGRFLDRFDRLGIPVVLNTHNVETDLSRQLAAISRTRLSRARSRLDTLRFDRFETQLLERAALVTAVSAVDAARLREMAPTASIEVVPSGADVAGTTWVDHSEVQLERLVLLGTLGYLPNLDGAEWFVAEVLPAIRDIRPKAHLTLVGSSSPTVIEHLVGPAVTLVGQVEDVAEELAAGDILVAPLRVGSGVRLKLLEAFAHGIPVVATSVAAEGIDVRDGVHLLIADDPRSFAAAVIRLLEDRELRSRLSTEARRLVEEKYDWRQIGDRFEALIGSVVAGSASATRS
jgi:glycosyltransferase involved in cell wall biosynthesis